MKKSNNAGFSLPEVLVAIAIFALTVVPLCGSMVLATRINAKAEATLQAQMAVSSVVENLKANGYTGNASGFAGFGETVTIETDATNKTITLSGEKLGVVKIFDCGSTLTIQDENELVTVEVQVGGVG